MREIGGLQKRIVQHCCEEELEGKRCDKPGDHVILWEEIGRGGSFKPSLNRLIVSFLVVSIKYGRLWDHFPRCEKSLREAIASFICYDLPVTLETAAGSPGPQASLDDVADDAFQ